MKTLVPRLMLVLLALAVLWLVTRDDTPLSAQDNKSFDSCSQLLTTVAEAIQDCSDLNSNWACYGSEDAGVDPPEYRFQALSDRRPLEVLKRIDTYYEGTVLMNLQVEGQTAPIKAILFGPTEVTATKPGAHDFLMRIDDQNLVCRATPPGMVISTESGQTGQIKINGIDIKLGSTAFTTVAGDNLTTIANLEGHVTVSIGNESVEVPVGFQVQVDGSGGQLRFLGPPTQSEYFNSPLLQWMTNDGAGLSSMVNTNKEKSARLHAAHRIWPDRRGADNELRAGMPVSVLCERRRYGHRRSDGSGWQARSLGGSADSRQGVACLQQRHRRAERRQPALQRSAADVQLRLHDCSARGSQPHRRQVPPDAGQADRLPTADAALCSRVSVRGSTVYGAGHRK